MRSRKLHILQANLRKTPVTQYALLNDEDIAGHGLLLIQEPHCFIDGEDNVVAPPTRQAKWQQFTPTDQRDERWPIRTLIYANQWTNARQIPIASPDITAVEMTAGDRRIMAVSIYVPCMANGVAEAGQTIQHMLGLIAEAKRDRPTHELIVAGDFNRHDPLWGGDRVQNSEGAEIVDFMDQMGLQIANRRGVATHESGTTIDLALVDQALHEEIEEWSVWPTQYGSDHEALNIVIAIEGYDQTTEARRLFRNTNWEKTAKDMNQVLDRELPPTVDNPTPNELDKYTAKITEFVSRHVLANTPRSKPSPHAKRWWSLDLTDLRNKYTRARNSATSLRRAGARNRDIEEEAKEAKKTFFDTCRRQRRTVWREFLDTPSNIWKASRYLHPAATSSFGRVPALKKHTQEANQPEEATTSEEIADVLINQFFGQRADAPPPPATSYPDRLEWTEVTKEEVHDTVKRLSPHKAPGPDGLPNIVWQKLWHVLGDATHYIVKTSISLGHLPSPWRVASILPLRKPGKDKKSYNEPSSYRPISLLATISKITEAVLAERLSYMDETFGLLPKAHYGGRKQRSTDDATTYLSEQIHWAWKRKMVLSLVAFDIKGAFNGVNLSILLHRLRMRRVPEIIVKWVESFCSGRQASIKVNGDETRIQDIEHAGLPQGSPLSPILFLFFNADLIASKGTDREDSVAFIDDYTVWVVGPNPEANTKTIEENILPRVEAWGRDSGATFESTKTEFIHFTRRPITLAELPKLQIMGNEVAPCSELKILGIIFDQGLRFKSHAARAATRGEKAALALGRLKGIRPSTTRQLAIATVTPVVDYGAPTWYPGAAQVVIHRLQRTTRIAAAATTAMFKSAALDVAVAEASFQTTMDRLRERTRRYWINIHTKHKKHRIWRLLDRLQQYKRHRSPLEKMAQMFDTTPASKLQVIKAFTKAPWQPRATVLIQEREEAIRNSIDPGCPEIYTDASSRNGLTGIGIFIPWNENLTRGKTIGTTPSTDAFHGELEAIKYATMALEMRLARVLPRTVEIRIASDCKRALGALNNPGGQKRQPIQDIYRSLSKIQSKNINLTFRWVPAHAGIHGNEIANTLAMRQTAQGCNPEPNGPIPHQPVLRQGKTPAQTIRATFQARKHGGHIKKLDRALPGPHTRKLYDNLTRAQAAVLSQMRSGYCRLNGYLNQINASETDKCQCGAVETVHHYLLECPRWTEERAKLKEDVGPRACELAHLLGGYQDEAKDGKLAKWSPDMKAVRRTIEFVQETGRLEER